MKKVFSFLKSEYQKLLSVVAVILLIVSGIFLFNTGKMEADSTDTFSGYAWSDNIGWISFNCTNVGCGSSNYGVTYSGGPTVFNVTGYAWSENIGWIKFGGLGNSPTGGSSSAILTVSNNKAELSGWARACAGTVAGDCTGASRTDGWDGWISLSGTNYGIEFNTVSGNSTGSSYAWGSDILGWISFSGVHIDPLTNVLPASIDAFTGPDCVTRTTPSTTATLSWATTGMASCDIYKGGTPIYNIPSGQLGSGNHVVTVDIPNSSFMLSCQGNNGNSYSSEVLTIQNLISCVPTQQNKKPGFIER